MGIAYLILFVGYLLISVFLIWLVRRIFRQHRFKRRLTWLAVAFVILFPSYDIIMQAALLKYYENTRQPLQQIIRTVEAPGSVYWEDNVWPGFDQNYRLHMIDYLLDGEHLDALAMNGEDGEIYLYRYGQGDIPEVFTKTADLPQYNYYVAINPVPLWFWEKPFIWADRMEITDNRTKELIAYSERYMGYSPRILVIKSLGYPFEGGMSAGNSEIYGLDDQVIFLKMNYIPAERARNGLRKWATHSTATNFVEHLRKGKIKKGGTDE